MKIKRVEKEQNQVKFRGVPAGSVVHFTESSILWLKTTGLDSGNCVRLHDGYLGSAGLNVSCQIVEGAFVEGAK